MDQNPLSASEEHNLRRRVQASDPNNGRCLVQNTITNIECCYCLPRRLYASHGLMDRLEWYWNMEYNTLNLDTRWNVFLASPLIRHSFDNGEFMLVPEDWVVDTYIEALVQTPDGLAARRETFPQIPNGPFLYRFLLLKGMDTYPVFRQVVQPKLGQPDITHYSPPFTDLPLLRSHIHPKFAIVDAGEKLYAVGLEATQRLAAEHHVLHSILRLYVSWTSDPPILGRSHQRASAHAALAADGGDSAGLPPELENGSERSMGTVPCRIGSDTRLTAAKLLWQQVGQRVWDHDAITSWSIKTKPLSRRVHVPWSQEYYHGENN